MIYYHDISTRWTEMGTSEELLKSHIAVAKKHGYRFVASVAQLNSEKTILLCFDDGFRGVWDHRGYFKAEGICPTVFIAVDLVGRPGYLRWSEINELQEQGFRFQSHTWTHRPLTEVPDAELSHETLDSKRVIEEKTGQKVDLFCFPCGFFSSKVLELARKAGYGTLVTSIPGRLSGLPFGGGDLLPRCLVQNATAGEFLSVLRGGLNLLTERYMKQHWRSDK